MTETIRCMSVATSSVVSAYDHHRTRLYGHTEDHREIIYLPGSSEVDYAEDVDLEELALQNLPRNLQTFDASLVADMEKKLLNVSPSEFTEFFIKVRDTEKQKLTRFSFDERPYLREVYDTPAPISPKMRTSS